ncbi:glycosyl transferase family 2 [Acidovorax delafieldii 2AN]|uniref:Glycosyl transferase family 2 n=1 Tax=Acidovorax delafieldii 2AN TaxID=573060 RepID=C5T0P4_ACIDE|nr:glycosyltransferase family 2 protein [Acidovorax delafieldii]EER61949.1 glycosyl transferase family 2 [Acidovorax delafieldii 2AN]
MKFSVVIPVYKNEDSIPRLLQAVTAMARELGGMLEVVFVVDGSPDRSFVLLRDALAGLGFPAQLLAHSRNFGSFPAIRTGLAVARGDYFGVMAADLQEPPELMVAFFRALQADECDVAIGTRTRRSDSWSSRMASGLFWALYRRLVVPDMPEGGVDVFGCNRVFRDHLLRLQESRSSLIALIFWLGFRRKLVGYERLERQEGVSSWTFRKKVDYMLDSVFAFTDYPIRMLTRIGFLGCVLSVILSVVILVGHITGRIVVPGYAPTMLVVLFFGAVNLLGLGLVGTYAWRTYENGKHRPLSVVALAITNEKDADAQ